MRNQAPDLHGVLLLDKPDGLSSNAALQRARKLLGWPKAGHTGTLDPLATGLLPVCLGEATKYSHTLLEADKTYEAGIRLGFRSTTGDAEGELERVAEPDVDTTRLEQVLRSFLGVTQQLPPMHSALKRDGRPLYAYAREGIELPRTAREITIRHLELLSFDRPADLAIRVTCSKGTYVRVLAADIGQALGCGGYLASLRRTRIGSLDVAGACSLEFLENQPVEARADGLLAVDCLLSGLPRVQLEAPEAHRVVNGLAGTVSGADAGLSRLYDADACFLGVGEVRSDGTVIPKRMLSAAARAGNGGLQARISP